MNLSRSGPWIAAVGLVAMLWLVISTVLYAPWWGVALHLIALIVVASRLPRLARSRPERTPWLILIALTAWVVVNVLGVGLLGWRV